MIISWSKNETWLICCLEVIACVSMCARISVVVYFGACLVAGSWRLLYAGDKQLSGSDVTWTQQNMVRMLKSACRFLLLTYRSVYYVFVLHTIQVQHIQKVFRHNTTGMAWYHRWWVEPGFFQTWCLELRPNQAETSSSEKRGQCWSASYWPAGGDSTDCQKKSVCMKVNTKIILLLTWLMSSVRIE